MLVLFLASTNSINEHFHIAFDTPCNVDHCNRLWTGFQALQTTEEGEVGKLSLSHDSSFPSTRLGYVLRFIVCKIDVNH